MRVISILFILLFTASCLTQKQRDKVCQSCPIIIKDSIREITKVTSFDTTLFISQMGKDILFPDVENGNCCEMVDSLYAMMSRGNGTIQTENGGVKSQIFKKDKKIVFRCEADSLKEVIKGLRVTIEKSSFKEETKVLPAPPCLKPHKDWLDKYDRPWLFISLGALLLWLGWKFKPKLLGIIKKLSP